MTKKKQAKKTKRRKKITKKSNRARNEGVGRGWGMSLDQKIKSQYGLR